MARTKTPQQVLEQARGFVRDYTSGLNVKEVRRLFDQEATAAYRVLARDQKKVDSKDEVTRFLQMVKVVFLGISARLSPTRRALFALSIAALLWASVGALGVRLGHGDLLVLFTDGLAEATDPGGRRAFGFEQLRQLAAAGGPASEVHRRILAAFDGHVGDGPLTDDVTLVLIGRDRPVPPPPPR